MTKFLTRHHRIRGGQFAKSQSDYRFLDASMDGEVPHKFVMFNVGENICGKPRCGKPKEHKIHKGDI